ncbi:MAG: relaxase/mobilization nuclease domain-containing protein [Ginsengibacter sp.]
MVARINTGKSISKALNYNEQKVANGKAECIIASGFIKDVNRLNFYDKLHHFERLISLNERTTINTLHVSLNFDSSDKINTEKLKAIARKYMQRIGFGNQPYVVYRHDDASHPHIHIVTTNIQSGGIRISLHNLGKNQSEKARKEIEIEFGLVKAQSSKQTNKLNTDSVNVPKIIYGKSETKRAITNVLMKVIPQYKFVSLSALNAVLKLYNVTAERGERDSRAHKNNGLIYRILDAQGNKTGIAIKASSIYMKPTLAFLENKFLENESFRKPHMKRIQTNIDWALNQKPNTLNGLKDTLEKESISMVIWKSKENIIYGITYIDRKTKCIFNGSELGKQYSAKTIVNRCKTEFKTQEKAVIKKEQMVYRNEKGIVISPSIKSDISKTLDNLSEPIPTGNYIPYQLKKSKKKKKKKRISI